MDGMEQPGVSEEVPLKLKDGMELTQSHAQGTAFQREGTASSEAREFVRFTCLGGKDSERAREASGFPLARLGAALRQRLSGNHSAPAHGHTSVCSKGPPFRAWCTLLSGAHPSAVALWLEPQRARLSRRTAGGRAALMSSDPSQHHTPQDVVGCGGHISKICGIDTSYLLKFTSEVD